MISVNGAVDYNSGPYNLLGLAQGVDVVSGGVGLSIERNQWKDFATINA